jgi:poly-beta-1,6-N-acetyl-D-glucosamine biosynthesis protein PgaD
VNELIIVGSGYRYHFKKAATFFLTFVIWIFFIYSLCFPLLVYLASQLSIEHAFIRDYFSHAGNLNPGILKFQVGISLVASFSLLIWAGINRARFRGRDRRRLVTHVRHGDVAKHYLIDNKKLARWKTLNNSTAYLDAAGELVDVQSNLSESDQRLDQNQDDELLILPTNDGPPDKRVNYATEVTHDETNEEEEEEEDAPESVFEAVQG